MSNFIPLKLNEIIFRTQASAAIGMGHFMRCVALAQACLEAGIPTRFALNDHPDFVKDWLDQLNSGFLGMQGEFGTLADSAALIKASGPGSVILWDGYGLDLNAIAVMSQKRFVTLIDDEAVFDHCKADVIINISESADRLGYETKGPGAIRLLGLKYALIRNEFQNAGRTPQSGRIVISLGGSDPKRLSQPVTETLLTLSPQFEIDLVIGAANADHSALKLWAGSQPRVHLHIAPDRLSSLYAQAEWVISAAGGSLHELAAMGQAVIGLMVVDNQIQNAETSPYAIYDARSGLRDDFAAWLKAQLADPAEGLRRAQQAQSRVDGLGAGRVINVLRSHFVAKAT